MKLVRSSLMLAAVVALSGCASTAEGIRRDIAGIRDLGKYAAADSPASVEQAKLDAYIAWAKVEQATLTELTERTAKPASMSWSYTPETVSIESATGRKRETTRVTIAQSFRISLPADAVARRHSAAQEAVQTMGIYAALRQAHEATELALTAPSPSDRAWLRQELLAGAAEVSPESALMKVREVDGPWAQVGFFSTGPTQRTAGSLPAPH